MTENGTQTKLVDTPKIENNVALFGTGNGFEKNITLNPALRGRKLAVRGVKAVTNLLLNTQTKTNRLATRFHFFNDRLVEIANTTVFAFNHWYTTIGKDIMTVREAIEATFQKEIQEARKNGYPGTIQWKSLKPVIDIHIVSDNPQQYLSLIHI